MLWIEITVCLQDLFNNFYPIKTFPALFCFLFFIIIIVKFNPGAYSHL